MKDAAWLLVPVVVAVFSACTVRDSDQPIERRVITNKWDTLFTVGTGSATDTSLLQPYRVFLWGERLVVADIAINDPRLRVFSIKGEELWSFGRLGEGPGEFQDLSFVDVAPNGNLLVLDPGLMRVTEITDRGGLVRVIPLESLPQRPIDMVVADGQVVFLGFKKTDGVMVTQFPDFRMVESYDLPWPDSVPLRRGGIRFTVSAENRQRKSWAWAFTQGPGFGVVTDRRSVARNYITPVAFDIDRGDYQQLGEFRVRTWSKADSTSFGAKQLAYVDDEVYMLFGGRPLRPAHPAEPTKFIDVYDKDGTYKRSYDLPVDGVGFITDGETFFVLTLDPHPQLLALRPKS